MFAIWPLEIVPSIEYDPEVVVTYPSDLSTNLKVQFEFSVIVPRICPSSSATKTPEMQLSLLIVTAIGVSLSLPANERDAVADIMPMAIIVIKMPFTKFLFI
jgi:hypothetical protein